jgi:hypothetical protein
VDILGMVRYANVYLDEIRLAGSGRIDLRPWSRTAFPLPDARRALDTVIEGKGLAVKVLVEG